MRYSKARFECQVVGLPVASSSLVISVDSYWEGVSALPLVVRFFPVNTLSLGSPRYHYDYRFVKSILRCTTAYPRSQRMRYMSFRVKARHSSG